MKQTYEKLFSGVALMTLLMLSSCQSPYKLVNTEGSMITIDSVWDTHPDAEAVALLAPYKASVDSMMYRVVGTSEMTMEKGRTGKFAIQSGSGCAERGCYPSFGQTCRYGSDEYGWFAEYSF